MSDTAPVVKNLGLERPWTQGKPNTTALLKEPSNKVTPNDTATLMISVHSTTIREAHNWAQGTLWKRRECKSQKGQRTAKGLLDTRGLAGVCSKTGHMLRFKPGASQH